MEPITPLQFLVAVTISQSLMILTVLVGILVNQHITYRIGRERS